MDIGSIQSGYTPNIKPQKPQEPTPPPGGNIENRQPPAEPTKPINQEKTQNINKLDVMV